MCLLTNVGKRVGRNVGKSVGSKVGPRVLIETKEEEVEILLLKKNMHIQYSRFTHGSNVGDNVGPSDLKGKAVNEMSVQMVSRDYMNIVISFNSR